MSLILKLEGMAGDNVSDTCHEMCAIAERVGVCVKVQFNDVTLMSYRGGDADILVERYQDAVSSDDKYKLASVMGEQ